MKIVFTSQSKNWDSALDERFGRAKGFVLFDEETKRISWHSNEDNLNAAHGAGIQAAQFVINTGASILITGQVGPKAFDLLKKSKIRIYKSENITIKEAYNKYILGELEKLNN